MNIKMNLKVRVDSLIEKYKALNLKTKRMLLMGTGLLLVIGVAGLGLTPDSSDIKENSKEVVAAKVAAYAIMADGKEIVKIASEEEANIVLEGVKANYLTAGSEVKEARFAEEVIVTPSGVTVKPEELMTTQEAITLILTGNREPKTYVVQGGDTVWDIAIENDLSPYELMEMNPGVENKISIGQTLNLYQVNPYVTVKTKEVVTATEKIEYRVQYENTTNLYKGQSQVKVAGNYGAKIVVAELVKENGVVVSSNTLSEEITAEPLTQVTILGTKTIPIKTGSGQLGVPVTNIEISSAYGSRGGTRHYGVDLRMPKGSSIMAADGGTVTKACYAGSYGNLIIINHGNGIETYYSHCDTMCVSIGQDVTKGQVIGTVGSTGNATGNHLHFEVRLDGVPQNPVNYF